MGNLNLTLAREEVLSLYSHLVRKGCPEQLDGLFLQLQKYLFTFLTIQEIQELSRD